MNSKYWKITKLFLHIKTTKNPHTLKMGGGSFFPPASVFYSIILLPNLLLSSREDQGTKNILSDV